jgi:hypothetical protein
VRLALVDAIKPYKLFVSARTNNGFLNRQSRDRSLAPHRPPAPCSVKSADDNFAPSVFSSLTIILVSFTLFWLPLTTSYPFPRFIEEIVTNDTTRTDVFWLSMVARKFTNIKSIKRSTSSTFENKFLNMAALKNFEKYFFGL